MTKEARLHNGEKTVSSTNGAGKTGQPHVKKNENRSFFNSTHKNKLQWIKDPYVRLDSIQLLEENTGRTLCHKSQQCISFEPPLRVMKLKSKVSKWDLIKLKSLCTAKETINKMKDNPQNGRK